MNHDLVKHLAEELLTNGILEDSEGNTHTLDDLQEFIKFDGLDENEGYCVKTYAIIYVEKFYGVLSEYFLEQQEIDEAVDRAVL